MLRFKSHKYFISVFLTDSNMSYKFIEGITVADLAFEAEGTSLKKLFPEQKKIFIIGFKFDKDVKKMLRQIVKIADVIIITEFKGKTDMAINASADASNLKTQISKLKSDAKVIIEKDLEKALKKAIKLSTIQQYNNPAIIVVTGSLYLVGEVRNML